MERAPPHGAGHTSWHVVPNQKLHLGPRGWSVAWNEPHRTDCNPLQSFAILCKGPFCKDSIPIRFRFESGSNPVEFRFDSTTQFLPNSYSIPPFILGQIVYSSRFGQINLSWGEYICKRTRERLLCHSNQDELPMDKKIVYSSRFVRVILAQGPC